LQFHLRRGTLKELFLFQQAMENFLTNFINAFDTQPLTAIPILAAIVAVFAALATWRSSKAARENLRMAKIDFEEKHDSIHAVLVDCVTWESEQNETIASFACTYTNSANAPNTLARLELIISAISQNGQTLTLVLDPVFDITISHRGFPQLSIPVNLSARATTSGWISFHIPAYLMQTKRIDRYQVSATTSGGKKLALDAHILGKI
jgi:hypothetical protein